MLRTASGLLVPPSAVKRTLALSIDVFEPGADDGLPTRLIFFASTEAGCRRAFARWKARGALPENGRVAEYPVQVYRRPPGNRR
jgi:hypothetical protein